MTCQFQICAHKIASAVFKGRKKEVSLIFGEIKGIFSLLALFSMSLSIWFRVAKIE
jgi:hypothetical protein